MPSPWIIAGIHPVEVEYVKENIVGEHVECHMPSTSPLNQSLPREESLGDSEDQLGQDREERLSTLLLKSH
jgi:hypothetical protein